MSVAWQTVLALTLATILIRAAGPVALGGRELSPRLEGIVGLLAPALLAALVVSETLGGEDGGLVLDERVAGVAVAAVLLSRWPRLLLTATLLAAVVTALLRAI